MFIPMQISQNTSIINFTGHRKTKKTVMKEDIFAETRNGHRRRDMFDKNANTLDIYSGGMYPSNVLSNLAHNSFKIDGVECASMEGFLQSLKEKDPEKQKEICKLYGGSAKKASGKNSAWAKTEKLYWNGKCYDRKSEEYHDLLYKAFLLCYIQNDIFKTALDSTKGIKLIHSAGRDNPSRTVLTSEEFTDILTRIRDGNK